mmetsp:Transcript_36014/g.84443  ORF Transcript_36014/g.84443 Transcript_36014/m.84443 type:complete len:256 (-) Transcript_36014:450-1217(-)
MPLCCSSSCNLLGLHRPLLLLFCHWQPRQRLPSLAFQLDWHQQYHLHHLQQLGLVQEIFRRMRCSRQLWRSHSSVEIRSARALALTTLMATPSWTSMGQRWPTRQILVPDARHGTMEDILFLVRTEMIRGRARAGVHSHGATSTLATATCPLFPRSPHTCRRQVSSGSPCTFPTRHAGAPILSLLRLPRSDCQSADALVLLGRRVPLRCKSTVSQSITRPRLVEPVRLGTRACIPSARCRRVKKPHLGVERAGAS